MLNGKTMFDDDVYVNTVKSFLGDRVYHEDDVFTSHVLDGFVADSETEGYTKLRIFVKTLKHRRNSLGLSFDSFVDYCVDMLKKLVPLYPFDERGEKLIVVEDTNGDKILAVETSTTSLSHGSYAFEFNFQKTTVRITGESFGSYIETLHPKSSPDNLIPAYLYSTSNSTLFSELLANILNVPLLFREHAYMTAPQIYLISKTGYECWLYFRYIDDELKHVNHVCEKHNAFFNKTVNRWVRSHHVQEPFNDLNRSPFKKNLNVPQRIDKEKLMLTNFYPQSLHLGIPQSENNVLHFGSPVFNTVPAAAVESLIFTHLLYKFPCRMLTEWEQENIGHLFNIMYTLSTSYMTTLNHENEHLIYSVFVRDGFKETFTSIANVFINSVSKLPADENHDKLYVEELEKIGKVFGKNLRPDQWEKLEGLPAEWVERI